MPAIGILGGMGPQASAKLYEMLIGGTKLYLPNAVDDDYPEIVLLNVPVPNFISNKNELSVVRQMLLDKTKLLEIAGCTVNAIACNTAHILLPELQASTKVQFLSIPNIVASKIQSTGFKRVGLLATSTTIKSSLYSDALEKIADLVLPNRELISKVETYIYKQLNSSLTSSDRDQFHELVEQFIHDENLDAVILGCTELPLVYGDRKDPKIIDSLSLLSGELLASYFGERPDIGVLTSRH